MSITNRKEKACAKTAKPPNPEKKSHSPNMSKYKVVDSQKSEKTEMEHETKPIPTRVKTKINDNFPLILKTGWYQSSMHEEALQSPVSTKPTVKQPKQKPRQN